jgi:predicted transcriptional regulator
MTIRSLITKLPITILTKNLDINTSFDSVYASDLLSNALARVDPTTAWITVQVHQNILGIGSIKQCPAILITDGAVPSDEVIQLAEEKEIPLLSCSLPTFELSGLLYTLLKEEQCGKSIPTDI